MFREPLTGTNTGATRSEGTEAGVSHHDGLLDVTSDSVGCHSDMTSRGNCGYSLGFEVDITVEAYCPSTVS